MHNAELEDRATTSSTLVAIAKNEGRYLLEWLAYHKLIGFDKIILFMNDCTDGSLEYCKKVACVSNWLEVVPWNSVENISPQLSAYSASRSMITTSWFGFIDIDEFVLLKGYDCINNLLSNVPTWASTLHLNWKGFGSSGRENSDYELVTSAFTRCAPMNWDNHYHFKTFCRTRAFRQATVHSINTSFGKSVLSDFSEFTAIKDAFSPRVVYGHCQLNHYQSKTWPEFVERMIRGNATFSFDSTMKRRSASQERFNQIDRNEEVDRQILTFEADLKTYISEIRSKVDLFGKAFPGLF